MKRKIEYFIIAFAFFNLMSHTTKGGGCEARFTFLGDTTYCQGDSINSHFSVIFHGPDCLSCNLATCGFLYWYKNGILDLTEPVGPNSIRTYTITDTGSYQGAFCFYGQGIGGGGSQLINVTYNTCTYVSAIVNIDDEVKIFPNPTNGIFKIEFPYKTKLVEISNLFGQSILTKEVHERSNLNIELFDNGIYLVHIKTANGTVTKKIVVCK